MFVSVNIIMFSAIYNIVFDISILYYMCGLPGHTYDDSGLILKARVWYRETSAANQDLIIQWSPIG